MIKRIHIFLLLFLILILLFDKGGGLILKSNFNKIDNGLYGKINRSLESKSEILILGSSRAQHHYIPNIISKLLNYKVYNAGLGGYGILYDYALLNTIIKNSKPKLVLLDISPNVIVDPKSFSKLNVFLPYIDIDSSFLEIIKLNPDYSRINLISKLYKYNSTLYDLIRSYESNVDTNMGYIPLSGEIDTARFSFFYYNSEPINNLKVKYFEKIITLCDNENVQLIVVVSPTFKKFDRKNKIINKMQDLCNKKNVLFFDFSNDKRLYGNAKYFKDMLHMNNLGANIFSKILSNKIKPLINEYQSTINADTFLKKY